MGKRVFSTKELFGMKVNKNSSDCWLWIACLNPKGYGSMMYRGRATAAHRVSWMLYVGSIPKGLYVLHKCDIRNCVNPEHLFLGNQQDNMDDMWSKGRGGFRARIGEKNPMSKLTRDKVEEIRKRDRSETHISLAKEFGVSRMTIYRARRGLSWAS